MLITRKLVTFILLGSFHSHSEFGQSLVLSTYYPNLEMAVQWGVFDLPFTGLWSDAAKSSILCVRGLTPAWVPPTLVLSMPPGPAGSPSAGAWEQQRWHTRTAAGVIQHCKSAVSNLENYVILELLRFHCLFFANSFLSPASFLPRLDVYFQTWAFGCVLICKASVYLRSSDESGYWETIFGKYLVLKDSDIIISQALDSIE